MLTIKRAALLFLFVTMPTLALAGESVDSTAALVAAVRNGAGSFSNGTASLTPITDWGNVPLVLHLKAH